MARERQRFEGELAAWHMGQIVSRFSGEQINPAEVNPYKPPLPASVMAAKAASEKRRFWAGLELALFGKVVRG